MVIQLQLRRGIAALWTAVNPVLASGEMGAETDTGKFKIGDGVHTWSLLSYSSGTIGIQGIPGLVIQGEQGEPGEDSLIPGPPGISVTGAQGATGLIFQGPDGEPGEDSYIQGQRGTTGATGPASFVPMVE